MRRSQFLKLAAGASAAMAGAALCGEAGSGSPAPGTPLDGWAARYRASVIRTSAGLQIVAHPRPDDLAAAMQDLCMLSESPVRCSGRSASGQLGGERFELKLEFELS